MRDFIGGDVAAPFAHQKNIRINWFIIYLLFAVLRQFPHSQSERRKHRKASGQRSSTQWQLLQQQQKASAHLNFVGWRRGLCKNRRKNGTTEKRQGGEHTFFWILFLENFYSDLLWKIFSVTLSFYYTISRFSVSSFLFLHFATLFLISLTVTLSLLRTLFLISLIICNFIYEKNLFLFHNILLAPIS